MATYKLVDTEQLDADLKTVADAIREKGGTTEQLAFPDGMASAVEAIQAGGDEPTPPADGKTRIYIHLDEGRTSPMLGVCPNGTVTVDWGDGTTPDTLTGTKTTTLKWTPNHNYAEAGDYVIALTVDGEMGILGEYNEGSALLRHINGNDKRNNIYRKSIQNIVFGDGVASIGAYGVQNCYNIKSVIVPDSVSGISVAAFEGCYGLENINIPESASLGNSLFKYCYSLETVTIPNGVTAIGSYTFQYCYRLRSVTIPNGVTSIGANAFDGCYSLSSVVLPTGITKIDKYAFQNCYSLTNITIPNSVTDFGTYAFSNCSGAKVYDFSSFTSVPTLSNVNSFNGIPDDCVFLIPAALYDEWSAATNWTTYASKMKAV